MLSQSDMMFGFCVCATLGGHIGETSLRQTDLFLISLFVYIQIHIHAIFLRKNRQRAEKMLECPIKVL